MKKYLYSIMSGGAYAVIGYYTDTPCKNYRVYYCGSDIGVRYEKLGNAARYLETIAKHWEKKGMQLKRDFCTVQAVPRHGSNV